MSLRSFIGSRVTQRLTSHERLTGLRSTADRRRAQRGEACLIDYFHDASDPYSQLAAQILPQLLDRYDVELTPHLVSPPPDWAAPDRDRLVSYSRLDGRRLAVRAGLDFCHGGKPPSGGRLQVAEAALARSISSGTFLREAGSIGKWLWAEEGAIPEAGGDAFVAKQSGDGKREELGHYLGGTFHLDGEWFWGIDRLHHLEARLAGAGLRRAGAPDMAIFPPPGLLSDPPPAPGAAPDLHYYLSFRSPYTYIAAERVKALAGAYGAALKLRFVLPMVMRGMQVPRTKSIYILKDAAREARRLAIPFGKVADPAGKPVERGYSLLPWAIAEGKGFDFALSFMRAVWAEGADAGSDSGLKRITERAGLDWRAARPLIGNEDWKAEAEANRSEMMGLGLWGVPGFRVGGISAWGQDRMWVIEDALKDASQPARNP